MEWIYELMLDIMGYASGELLGVLSMDLSYFEKTAPVISDIVDVFIALGWALLIGNLVFQMLKVIMSGAGFEAEDPKMIFLRTFAFSFLLLASRQICEIGSNIAGTVIDLLEMPDSFEVKAPSESMFSFGGEAKWLLVIIVGIILMVQMVKLLFEVGERYVITSVLTYFAPLAFSMGGSRNTNDIFKGWCRMYGSMLVMMIMNIVFLKLIMSAMEQMSSGGVLIWTVFVIALTRVARKIDSHIGKIGLNPAQTGDGIGSRFPGVMTMMAVRVMSSTVSRSLAGANGSSCRNGSGSGSGRGSGSHPRRHPSSYTGSGPTRRGSAYNGLGGAGHYLGEVSVSTDTSSTAVHSSSSEAGNTSVSGANVNGGQKVNNPNSIRPVFEGGQYIGQTDRHSKGNTSPGQHNNSGKPGSTIVPPGQLSPNHIGGTSVHSVGAEESKSVEKILGTKDGQGISQKPLHHSGSVVRPPLPRSTSDGSAPTGNPVSSDAHTYGGRQSLETHGCSVSLPKNSSESKDGTPGSNGSGAAKYQTSAAVHTSIENRGGTVPLPKGISSPSPNVGAQSGKNGATGGNGTNSEIKSIVSQLPVGGPTTLENRGGSVQLPKGGTVSGDQAGKNGTPGGVGSSSKSDKTSVHSTLDNHGGSAQLPKGSATEKSVEIRPGQSSVSEAAALPKGSAPTGANSTPGSANVGVQGGKPGDTGARSTHHNIADNKTPGGHSETTVISKGSAAEGSTVQPPKSGAAPAGKSAEHSTLTRNSDHGGAVSAPSSQNTSHGGDTTVINQNMEHGGTVEKQNSEHYGQDRFSEKNGERVRETRTGGTLGRRTQNNSESQPRINHEYRHGKYDPASANKKADRPFYVKDTLRDSRVNRMKREEVKHDELRKRERKKRR